MEWQHDRCNKIIIITIKNSSECSYQLFVVVFFFKTKWLFVKRLCGFDGIVVWTLFRKVDLESYIFKMCRKFPHVASVSVTCNMHVAMVDGHQWWVDIRSSLLSEKSQFLCKCGFIPDYFGVNGLLFKVRDSNEAMKCLRKSAWFCFVFFFCSGWVSAWLKESLLSNSNILDAVIGTNQVWCAEANVCSVFSFMEMFKHLLRVHAHLN